MPTFIHHLDAHCALGLGLEASVAGVLAAQQPVTELAFDQQRDPVRMPYCVLPEDTSGDDFYQYLERRSEEHTSELQSRGHLVCRLLLEKKKTHSVPTLSTTT